MQVLKLAKPKSSGNNTIKISVKLIAGQLLLITFFYRFKILLTAFVKAIKFFRLRYNNNSRNKYAAIFIENAGGRNETVIGVKFICIAVQAV